MVTFSRAASAASELFTLIDRQSKINPFDESGEMLDETRGSINLHGINFSYPTRPDVTVLEDFTLNIPAGKVTALVVSLPDHFCHRDVYLRRGQRDHPAQAKAPSSVYSNGGIIPVEAASPWMARISVSSTSNGYEPMSVWCNR